MQINILEYLEHGALRHSADKVAIVEPERSYTFAELERYAKRCAALLLQRTDSICQPIAVYLPKCANVIFADLGILYSGNLYSNQDTKSPGQRTRNILTNIDPVLVITSRDLAPQLDAIGVSAERLFFIEAIYDDNVESDDSALRQRLGRVIDTDPVCIINTSGSTGTPKGVVLNHRSTIDFMDWCFERMPLDAIERIGSPSPLFFVIFTPALKQRQT